MQGQDQIELKDLAPQDLAKMVWSCASSRVLEDTLIARISCSVWDSLPQFDAQCLSSTVWSFATLRRSDKPLLAAVASCSVPTVTQFSPRHISTTAWAYAKLRLRHVPLMKAISYTALAPGSLEDMLLNKFRPAEPANSVWACGTLEFLGRPALGAIASSAAPQMTRSSRRRPYRPQDLSNIAWAFARIRVLNSPLLDAVATASIHQIHDFGPQHLATTAWSFARLRLLQLPLFDALAESATRRRVEDFRTQHLANIVWACALLRYEHTQLMDCVSGWTVSKASEFAHMELSNTAWAFAALSFVDEHLLETVASAAGSKIDAMDAQAVAAMIDAGVKSEALEHFFDDALDGFLQALPDTADGWQSADSKLLATAAVADNFGVSGTSKVLQAWSLSAADSTFHRRAAEAAAWEMASDSRLLADASDGAWAFLEWEVGESPSSRQGSAVCVTGHSFAQPTESESWWAEESPIRAFQLAVRGNVQRAACAEFRLLARLAAELQQERQEGTSDAETRLQVRLFASKTPCLSCLAAMRQFQLLFPRTQFYFASERMA
eukprot:gb/GFBE01021713.1/.p1 GENE.gb/GFBE01021713.1/~~gb/GFBE01021713.1/.p1  ORF type:complete len:552 (+),score=93.88 gb/GFBE01021713.1/:1-1656(+)